MANWKQMDGYYEARENRPMDWINLLICLGSPWVIMLLLISLFPLFILRYYVLQLAAELLVYCLSITKPNKWTHS